MKFLSYKKKSIFRLITKKKYTLESSFSESSGLTPNDFPTFFLTKQNLLHEARISNLSQRSFSQRQSISRSPQIQN